MGLMWLGVGGLAGLSAWVLYEIKKRFQVDWKAWTGLLTGIFLVLFGIAWFVSSILEGVPQSDNMGTILFDGLGLILLVLTWRFFLQHKKKNNKSELEKSAILDNNEIDSPKVDTSRRKFLSSSILGALNVKHIIGGIIGLGASNHHSLISISDK